MYDKCPVLLILDPPWDTEMRWKRCGGLMLSALHSLLNILDLSPGWGPGGRDGGSPLYGLYRYVPQDSAWFLEVLNP